MNILKKNLRNTLLFAAVTAAVPVAMAVKISGAISFDGSTTLDAPIPGASSFLDFTDVRVSTGTQMGDYLGTGGANVSMNGITFSPFEAPMSALWSFTDDGKDYSFWLDSLTSVERTNLGSGLHQLSLSGSGTASITGFEDTGGVFSITTTGNTEATSLGFGAFTFATQTDSVPDGGSAAVLLGAGLLGLAVVQRKMKYRVNN